MKIQSTWDNDNKSILYLVPVPIGNLQDLAPRSITYLKSAEIIICEDSRKTNVLLNQLNIDQKPLVIFSKYHEDQKKIQQIKLTLDKHQSVALVSDAGYPLINDPGYLILQLCSLKNIKIIIASTCSAVMAALCLCGFSLTKGFKYVTYFNDRQIAKQIDFTSPVYVGFLTKFNCIKCLLEIKDKIGEESECFIGREITKIHETLVWGTISECINYFQQTPPRGELTIVINIAKILSTKNKTKKLL